MHTNDIILFFKWVQSRVGAIPRLPIIIFVKFKYILLYSIIIIIIIRLFEINIEVYNITEEY